MKIYSDYEYYKEEYKGQLTASLFDNYILEACRIVDRNVNKKLEEEDITNEVKDVVCALVDYLNENGNVLTKNITSVSVDGVAESYGAKTIQDINLEKKYILDGLPQELTRYL